MAPMKEMVKKETFWNNLGKVVDRVRNGYRLCVLGDLNGCIGNRVRAGITSAFGVPGEKGRVLEFCAERGQCVGNTYFKHKFA